MAAYYIVDLEVTDAGEFEEYRRLVAPMVANYGGRYVVRGGALETVEGDWSPNRLVILEFDSMERLKSWYESDEYRPVKAIRHRSAISKAVIVEGIV
ncbi:MAG: D-fructose-6-phosphate amidotransferase [Planctomyces sp.]|nr:D-fructose-6-phosphate amidotransferase [Planctomyces sp.]